MNFLMQKICLQNFIKAINQHSISLMTDFLSDDHTFTDAHGNEINGNENVLKAWEKYFSLFPDYFIEITEIFETEKAIAAFGFAGESAETDGSNRQTLWKVPAAWKAEITDGKVISWLVMADTKIPFDALTGKPDQASLQKPTGKVTFVGGIFFKCHDPEKLKEWYHNRLGLNTDQYGTSFEFRLADNPSQKGFLQWSLFDKDTKYIEPSPKDFMINYRVQNLDQLLDQLKAHDVVILDEVETYEYGRFVHILDPEGNKIELWEPVDEEFDKIAEGRTK